MAKPAKPLIFGLSALGLILVILLIMLVPIGGRTLLAKALDTTGQHKLAMGTDLFYQGKANGFLQNLNLTDLSQPEQCQNAYKIIQNEKMNLFQGLSGKNKITVKPSGNDKILLESFLSGSVNPQSRKLSANWELSSRVDQNVLKEILTEMDGASLQSVMPLEAKAQASTFIDINQLLFTVNKFDFKTADLTSSNGLSNYYKADFTKPSSDQEKLRQEGLDEILNEVKTATSVKISEILSEETLKSLSQLACQTIAKTEVLGPVEKDFGAGKVSVRPVVITYKPDFFETHLNYSAKQQEVLEKDQKLKDFLYSKFPSLVKMATSLEKVTGEAVKYKDGKLIKNLSQEELQQAEAEYKKDIDQLFSTKNPDGTPKANSDELIANQKEMAKYYNLSLAPATTFIDMTTGDIYGSQARALVNLTEEATKNMSPKVKELVGNQLEIIVISYDTKYGSQVEDLPTPTNTKTIEEFTKDILKTDGAKKIQEEAENLAPQSSSLQSSLSSNLTDGSFGGNYGGGMSETTISTGLSFSNPSNNFRSSSSSFANSMITELNTGSNVDFGN